MKYAIEIYDGDDWGDGPEYESGYEFHSLNGALIEIRRRMSQFDCGTGWVGARVVSDFKDEWDSPLVEETLTPAAFGL